MRQVWFGLALLIGVGLSGPAPADDAPSRVAGTVATFDGATLVVASPGGGTTSIAVPAEARVTALANRTLADIKKGEFVGSAAVMGADGKLHAQEVHIFPESMRGAGEGHRPMSGPKQSMTNATVAQTVVAAQGQELTLKYPGGEQQIEVGPDARIVTFIPGDRGLLKPGAAVSVFVTRAPDGKLTARFIQAEKDGVKPL